MVAEHDVQRIVIAGSSDSTGALVRTLPSGVAARVAGVLPASRDDPASQLVARAVDLIGRVSARETAASLDAVLTEAAKGGVSAASLESVLDALQRGAVDRLYMLRDFRERGRACPDCAALQPGDMATCRICRRGTVAVELGEAMISRATAAGGAVTMVDLHAGLAAVGGVAARLRFPL
jgi:peptide subunit release factor 1 (eRF1)